MSFATLRLSNDQDLCKYLNDILRVLRDGETRENAFLQREKLSGQNPQIQLKSQPSGRFSCDGFVAALLSSPERCYQGEVLTCRHLPLKGAFQYLQFVQKVVLRGERSGERERE